MTAEHDATSTWQYAISTRLLPALQVVGALAAVAGIVLIAGGGYVYRDTIKDGISWFISVVRFSHAH